MAELRRDNPQMTKTHKNHKSNQKGSNQDQEQEQTKIKSINNVSECIGVVDF